MNVQPGHGTDLKVLAWPARSNASRNPYQKLLYDAVEATGAEVVEFAPHLPFVGGRADILHLHWPDAFLAGGAGWRYWPRYLYLRCLMAVAKLRGTKVIWTAHNLQREGQRHGKRMARLFWPWFLGRIDGVIFMTEVSREAAGAVDDRIAATPQAVIPHGHYGSVLHRTPDAVPAELPLQALFFGSITAYKQVWRVAEAFLEVPTGAARLTICGKMSLREPDLRLPEVLDRLPAERRAEVRYEDRFLPDADLEERLSTADIAVFPYGDVLNSGAAIFALSAARVILASDAPLFRELQAIVGPEWVRLIDGALDGAQLLAALAHGRALRTQGRAPDLSALEWASIAEQTVEFYRQVAGKAARDQDTPDGQS